jgi:hypothetical protein
MTQPDDARRAESQMSMTAQDRLRTELLSSGLYDWVPMAEIETAITYYCLAETLSAQQDLALQTIRSLLEDGLMEDWRPSGPGREIPGMGPLDRRGHGTGARPLRSPLRRSNTMGVLNLARSYRIRKANCGRR